MKYVKWIIDAFCYMVKILVDAGADLNVRDEDGSTALMCAAEHGYMEMVKYLMSQPDADLSAKDNDGLTALAVAMEAGHRQYPRHQHPLLHQNLRHQNWKA